MEVSRVRASQRKCDGQRESQDVAHVALWANTETFSVNRNLPWEAFNRFSVGFCELIYIFKY